MLVQHDEDDESSRLRIEITVDVGFDFVAILRLEEGAGTVASSSSRSNGLCSCPHTSKLPLGAVVDVVISADADADESLRNCFDTADAYAFCFASRCRIRFIIDN